MPYLNLVSGELWAETWGVMHFPDDEKKRRGYIARLWAGFYPEYEAAGVGEPLPRPVLLSVMKEAAAAPVETSEVRRRRKQALLAGEWLKVLIAVAETHPQHASWRMTERLVERQAKATRSGLYEARRKFFPVIHLWTAFILRGQRWHDNPSCSYTALDDLNVFITEAMAVLQRGTSFKLRRAKAEPVLNRNKVDFWTPPPNWTPPIARPEWPRDGRVRTFCLPEKWAARVGKAPLKRAR
jgi:hypothetical protein